jgi:hypothetical protein
LWKQFASIFLPETARADEARDGKMGHKIFLRRFSNGGKETIR